MMKIATWNVNSVKVRLDAVSEWLGLHRPDFLLLQEIKCKTEVFPVEAFDRAGYHSTVLGQPGYNGVAILSKHPVTLVASSLLHKTTDEHARFLHVTSGDLHIINIYAPNGNPIGTDKFVKKLEWLERLHGYCKNLLAQKQDFVIGGDFNIIPSPLDAAHPQAWANDALFQPESRQMWQAFLHLGLTDACRALHPHQEDIYTFWDYQGGAWRNNDGIRIDHFLMSPALADNLEKCWVDKEPRDKERPSDHTPLVVEFNSQA